MLIASGSQQLKESVQKTGPQPRILAVTSGKGGVGKTNISANLGICLSAAGKRVLLVDADLGLGNLDVIINAQCRYNISDLIRGRRTIEQIIEVGAGGVEILAASSGLEEFADLNEFQRHRLLQELAALQKNYDVMILDTGAGISGTVIAFCLAADQTLVVTTPEPSAMTDAYAMIKLLVRNGYRGKVSLVVNMAETVGEAKKTYKRICEVARRFLNTYIYDAGALLKDRNVPDAVRLRQAFVLEYPKAKISASLSSMAARLIKCPITNSKQNSFFSRVADWFA